MGKYIVRQTKGIKEIAVKEITHINIGTLEEAIALAKKVDAECVEEIFKWWDGKIPLSVVVWRNEDVK